MAHDLTVWGVGTSRTMRAHWMLLELGLEYACHPIQPLPETVSYYQQRVALRPAYQAALKKNFVEYKG